MQSCMVLRFAVLLRCAVSLRGPADGCSSWALPRACDAWELSHHSGLQHTPAGADCECLLLVLLKRHLLPPPNLRNSCSLRLIDICEKVCTLLPCADARVLAWTRPGDLWSHVSRPAFHQHPGV